MDPKTLFTSPYDQKTFTKLLKGLLGEEYQDEGKYETKEIGQGFEYLTHYSRLGNIELDNGGYKEQVLVLEIAQKSINDARVSITKETIKLIKKMGFSQGYYTVLVVFRSETNPDNWRFSLIKSNDGDKWNNARRFSYYLGKNEGYKTPKQYLIDAGQIKDLKDLVSRFDVEVVRKEFFNLYINLFLELYQEVKKYQYCFRSINNGSLIDLVSFSKNLMGKMIFLYFIQKKGWLGLTADQNFKDHPGDQQFFKNNFTKLAGDENTFQGGVNFYNDFLEPLFYSGLNKKNPNDWHEKLQMKVPYLNGGLFEEEYKDRETTPLPLENNLFKAIVDAFDTYNFTIDENDPMDQEIAVDPEMLGKIFENMISINNQNIDEIIDLYLKKKKGTEYPTVETSKNINFANDLNKQLGAFYTPREIVQYMTKESLTIFLITQLKHIYPENNYDQIMISLFNRKNNHLTLAELDTNKEKEQYETLKSIIIDIRDILKKCKILDPAVGSGAFPMGILQEIFGLRKYIRDTFGLDDSKTDYDIKYEIVRDNIYGVDIDPGAVDIARLRFWLSLIINTPEPIPLPNLDFKFVCANSLIQLPEHSTDHLFGHTQKVSKDQFKANVKKFFDPDQSSKHIVRNNIKNYIQEIVVEKINNVHTYSNVINIDERSHILRELKLKKNEDAIALLQSEMNLRSSYENILEGKKPILFFEPEYMFPDVENGKFDIVIGNPPYVQLQKFSGQQIQKDLEAQKYLSFTRMGDLYCIFYERGNQLLKTGGILSYITSNKWMRAGYGEKMRQYFIDHTDPLQLIDFGGVKVFESATVDTNILICRKGINQKKLHATAIGNDYKIDDNLTTYIQSNSVTLSDLTSGSWFIGNSAELSLKAKIESKGKALKDWDINIYRGVLTGLNEAFIIDENKKNELIGQDPKSVEIIKPILRGRDIKKYGYEFAGLYLINTHNGTRGKIPRINCVTEYPAIYSYLESFLPAIEKRQDKGEHRSNLRNCAYTEEFAKEKIVYQEITQGSCFSYDPNGEMYIGNTAYLITGEKLKYLIALLNSNFIEYTYKNYYCTSLGVSGIRRLHQHMVDLPIPYPTPTQEAAIITLVDQILSAKKLDPKADTGIFEKMIDQLVYELYELTDEEIAIVEGERGSREEWDRINFE